MAETRDNGYVYDKLLKRERDTIDYEDDLCKESVIITVGGGVADR